MTSFRSETVSVGIDRLSKPRRKTNARMHDWEIVYVLCIAKKDLIYRVPQLKLPLKVSEKDEENFELKIFIHTFNDGASEIFFKKADLQLYQKLTLTSLF